MTVSFVALTVAAVAVVGVADVDVSEIFVVAGSTIARKAFTSLWIYFIMPK